MTIDQDQIRQSLHDQMPQALLEALGGIPDPWPDGAPRLVMDLQVVVRARVDLANAGVVAADYPNVRVKGLTSRAGPASTGLARPLPDELILFIGPVGAASLSDPGVKRFARGAFPLELSGGAGADGGTVTSALHSLVLEPNAVSDLHDTVLKDGKFELLMMMRVPIDTAADKRAPAGGAKIDLVLSMELIP
ncbi:MAG: hypothetical protein JST92_11095 [Deltaproteobacteria bacterium]|nr:hypothetical protein [Deltaproteobacteria bacterium]